MAALLALLAAVGWGSSDYAAGSASRRSSAVSVVVLTHFAASVVLVCVAVDFGPVWAMLVDMWQSVRPTQAPQAVDTTEGIRLAGPGIGASPTLGDILWGLAAGIGGGLGAMLLFRGLGKGSMAVVAPITATGAAAIPALYGIAVGETLKFPGVLGIVLALVAIVLVSLAGDADVTDPSPVEADRVGAFPPPVLGSIAHPAVAAARIELLPPPPVHESVARSAATVVLPTAPRNPPSLSGRLPGPPPPPAPGDPRSGESVGRVPPPHDEASPPSADVAGEIRMSLRRMRGTIVSLTVAALLAAAVAAAGPIGAIIAGDGLGAGDVAALVVAIGVVGLALSAANAAKLLFQVQAARPVDLERRTDPPSFDERPQRIERRVDASSFDIRAILRQPGVPEALLSGLGFGMFFVFISRAAESAGYWPLVSARAISVVMFAIAALVTTTAVLPERGSRRAVVFAGLLDAAAAVFFVMSTRAGLLSVGAVLASLYPVVTVLLARFVGGERIRREQLIGLALAIGAVSLLAI